MNRFILTRSRILSYFSGFVHKWQYLLTIDSRSYTNQCWWSHGWLRKIPLDVMSDVSCGRAPRNDVNSIGQAWTPLNTPSILHLGDLPVHHDGGSAALMGEPRLLEANPRRPRLHKRRLTANRGLTATWRTVAPWLLPPVAGDVFAHNSASMDRELTNKWHWLIVVNNKG